MIRLDAVCMAVEPLDMRAGTEAALARVATVLGHDGIGVWLAARRLNSGKFAWPQEVSGARRLSRPQSDALDTGLELLVPRRLPRRRELVRRCRRPGYRRREHRCRAVRLARFIA